MVRDMGLGLSFDSSRCQSSNEKLTGHEVNEQRRQGGEKRGCHVDVVFLHSVGRVHNVVQSCHDGLLTYFAKSEGKDEIVVNPGEDEDDRHHDDGR